ncbi:efflux RND transporter periplasmic adaptor subunit [Desulfotomaculum copahuensis]|uniref:efflux RND transporter periplasmic adaptor subunit n=1 Tax=Desulfotomaculum copahuensis TaxID=1838280 RepID=UPI00191B9B6F|nr:efflux RND transporter periplasmic adaptor subunit [Desulfotomaculum copahuensis]
MEVKPQTVAHGFKEEGIVEAALDRSVYSMVSGEIISLPVKEGRHVSAGDLLARLDSRDLEYQLAQLTAQRNSLAGQELKSNRETGQQVDQQQLAVEEAKRQLAKSENDYHRVKFLYDSGAVAGTELEAAENTVKQWQNNLARQESKLGYLQEEAGSGGAVAGGSTADRQYYQGMIDAVEAQIKQVEEQIANCRITAPVDGVVLELDARQGMVVSPQVPLMKLAGTGGCEINAYVLTEDVLPVKEGMPVTITQKRKDGDYRFQGIVQAIAPAAVEKVSALGLVERRVKVTIQPKGKPPELRPGYALDVQFTVLKQQNRLAVPKTCVFPYAGGDALWVVRDGRAVIQKVKKGMETDELLVIEQGLRNGDKVVKNPQLEGLKEGKRIIVAA